MHFFATVNLQFSLPTWTALEVMNQNHHHGDRARQSSINPLHCDNKLASFPILEWPGNEANNNPPGLTWIFTISKHVCQLLPKVIAFLHDNLPATDSSHIRHKTNDWLTFLTLSSLLASSFFNASATRPLNLVERRRNRSHVMIGK